MAVTPEVRNIKTILESSGEGLRMNLVFISLKKTTLTMLVSSAGLLPTLSGSLPHL